jgi:hypothetical protein
MKIAVFIKAHKPHIYKWTSRKPQIRKLGDLIAMKFFVDNEYEKIIHLNDKKVNSPFADLYSEKEHERLVISVKYTPNLKWAVY